jgi:hypothetical protein
MSWIEATIVELILFGIAWAAWTVATRNIRDFFELRLRIKRTLERIADQAEPAPAGEGAQPQGTRAERMAAPAETFGALGFELLLFAQRAPLSARFARFMGYDAVRAGDQLVSLARDGELVFRCRLIAQALRFKDDEAPTSVPVSSPASSS